MWFIPDIKYVEGTDVVADALNRRIDLATLHVSSVVSDALLAEISKGCAGDPKSEESLDQGTVN